MNTLRMARLAMATRFELLLVGQDEDRLRSVGEEALDEVSRFERRLSYFDCRSEISRINEQAGCGQCRVDGELFDVFDEALRLSAITDGAFDITVTPLLESWGIFGDYVREPSMDALERAMELTGWDKVKLDSTRSTIQFARPEMKLNLGGLGKGIALDAVREILLEGGIEHALVHGGTSSVLALGRNPDGLPWKIGLDHPIVRDREKADASRQNSVWTIELYNETLSVSAVWGRDLKTVQGRPVAHVIDPRVGRPVEGALLSAVVSDSATQADGLSTALLVLGRDGLSMSVRDAFDRGLVMNYHQGDQKLVIDHIGFESPDEIRTNFVAGGEGL